MKQSILLLIAVCGLAVFAVEADASGDPVYAPGETLTYAIRKFGMKAGETVIQYHGIVEDEGESRILITFTAKGFNFLDDEKIFADPQTLLPVKVERDLNIFGKKEQIVERYDLQKNNVTIRKYQGGTFIEEIVFTKEEPIDNLYCYIFRYRYQGRFAQGVTLRMPLPTKDVNFEILRRETIAAMGRRHDAWFMQSNPPEYQVWFGTGDQKIPLRIDGAVGLAKTVMVLERYEKGKIE